MNFEQFLKTETTNEVFLTKTLDGNDLGKKDDDKKDEIIEDRSNCKKSKKNESTKNVICKKRYNFEKLNALDADKQFREERDEDLFNANEFLFKKGDFVTIVRTPRKEGDTNVRLCDIYVGYFGEIREFNKGSDIATVMFEATFNLQKIKIPIECLVKRHN